MLKGSVALFMAEICRKSIQEVEENRDLFHFLLETLRWLDASPHPIANVHLYYAGPLCLLRLFAQIDFEASEERFFDLKEGNFSSVPPQHIHHLEVGETQQLVQLLNTSLENCHEVILSRAERKVLLTKLLKYYEFHVGGFSGANTPEILEMVLG
ncbi:MAG: DNA repair protein RecO C-terminal domain-containing protein [Saprospiraceae bacterium]